MKVIRDEGTIIFCPEKDLTATVEEEMSRRVHFLIQEVPSKFVFDLTGVEMIDSSGLGVLLVALKKLRAQNGEMSIINVTPNLYTYLRVMRIHNRCDLVQAPE